MKLLHIDSSITGANSISRQVSAEVVKSWRERVPGLTVIYRDLEQDRLPHVDSRLVGALFAGWKSEDPAIQADVAEARAILDEFLSAALALCEQQPARNRECREPLAQSRCFPDQRRTLGRPGFRQPGLRRNTVALRAAPLRPVCRQEG